MLFVLGAVQFVNVLDFMMVMPLGPFFAADLHVPADRVAEVGAAYTAAACVAGILISPWLDRLDRRTALGLTMAGLTVGTLLGGFSRTLPELLAARVLAGVFGGPATAIALAIVTDVIPADRRGAALGKVMGAFAVSSIFGVPAGLWMARHGGWRAPFFGVATLGLLVGVAAWAVLPRMVGHLEHAVPHRALDVLRVRGVPLALASVAGMTMGGFAVIPSLPMFIQVNLSFPLDDLWQLYLVGGVFSFVALRIGGGLVDRMGSLKIAIVGTVLLSVGLGIVFVESAAIPPYFLYIFFMSGNALRNVAWSALASKVPPPDLRAGYLSAQSAVQHGASAVGALLSTWVLAERSDGGVLGMGVLATISFALFVAALLPMSAVAKQVRAAPTP